MRGKPKIVRRRPRPEGQCAACGLPTLAPLCHFDQRTVELVKARRCVSCTDPVSDVDRQRIYGKCQDCHGRGNRSAPSTDWVLRKASNARYYAVH